MLNEGDCRELHLPITPQWSPKNSPLIAMHDREIGGLTTIFLGEPGAGKTRASYLRAWRMFRRERLFVRGLEKHHLWHWRFGKRAIVWVPKGTTFHLLEAQEYGGGEIPVRVETYSGYADLLRRAKVGYANVLYWGPNALDHWSEFLAALLRRPDRLPQLVLDDEVQAVAPMSAAKGQGYERVREVQEWMRQARESNVSSLFSTQIDYQMDYNVGQLAHFYVFMAGSRVPDRVKGALPRGTYLRTSGLPPGKGFVVGRTASGYRYQPVRFVDKMQVECKTVSVVNGPPEAPKVTGKRAKMQAEKERIENLLTQGMTEAEVARKLHVSLRTVANRLCATFPPTPS